MSHQDMVTLLVSTTYIYKMDWTCLSQIEDSFENYGRGYSEIDL